MSGKLSAVSLFSGCGGFDWGAKQVDVEIVWANDIDPHAAYAYKSIFPNVEFHLNDIRDISSFPQAEILIGCYPCTGFSVASRRRWRDRNSRHLIDNKTNFLYKEFLRALQLIKPKYLFVENVRGMRSADGGWFLEEQLSGFQESGYKVCAPELLDANLYGVAQSRKRIFIVGVRKDIEFDYVYPELNPESKETKKKLVLKDVISGMEEWPKGDFFDYKFHGHYLTRNRKRGWNEASYTIVADAHHIPLHPMGEPMKFLQKDTWMLQGNANRRLSWRECALIQDLPKHMEFSGNLADKYRIIGNAVPPALGTALLKPVIKFEKLT